MSHTPSLRTTVTHKHSHVPDRAPECCWSCPVATFFPVLHTGGGADKCCRPPTPPFLLSTGHFMADVMWVGKHRVGALCQRRVASLSRLCVCVMWCWRLFLVCRLCIKLQRRRAPGPCWGLQEQGLGRPRRPIRLCLSACPPPCCAPWIRGRHQPTSKGSADKGRNGGGTRAKSGRRPLPHVSSPLASLNSQKFYRGTSVGRGGPPSVAVRHKVCRASDAISTTGGTPRAGP
jgi:hypothetical protein